MIADEIRALAARCALLDATVADAIFALADRVEAVERDAAIGRLALRWHQSPADIAESRTIDLHAACGRALRAAIKEQADADKPKTYFNPNEGFGPI